MKKHILIVGCCGSGKTWVMKEIIKQLAPKESGKFNLVRFLLKDKICITGKYDQSMFEGSDKLSMAVSKDFRNFKTLVDKQDWLVIAEGDRFTNLNFINTFNPYIIKIEDKGEKGRKIRGSKQTKEHLQRIETRVKNIKHDLVLPSSTEVLNKIKTLILSNEKN